MISEESLYIEDGENLTKNELKSRLHQMEIEFDNSNQRKNYFVDLYNKAMKYTNNRKKIDERLKKDTTEHFERRQKRNRDTSEEAGKVLNIKGRTSKLESREPVKIENKIDTGLNIKSGQSNNFSLVRNKNPLEEEIKNFVMEDEKIEVKRNTINVAEFFPKREIALNNVSESISKFRSSEASATIENKQNLNRKLGISTGKIVIKKISGANLMSLNLNQNSQASKPIPVEPKNLLNFNPSVIPEEPSVASFDTNKKYSFGVEKNEIKPDNILNNEQLFSTKSKIQNLSGTDVPSFFQNKRRTSFSGGVLSSYPMKLQTTGDFIENYSKTSTPYESKKIQSPKEQFEENQKIKNVRPVEIWNISEKSVKEKEMNENLNGAHLGETGNITINSIKFIPIVKKENGMDLSPIWRGEGPSGTSLKQLIKYFLTGVACSVIISGIYYLIKFSPAINFDTIWVKNVNNGEKNSIILNPDDFVKATTTSKNFNLGGDVGTEKFKIIDLENQAGPGIFTTFNDKLSEFFRPVGKIFEFIINPKRILFDIIIEGAKYLAVNLAWGWIKNNVWMFALIFFLKLITIKGYYYARNRRNANKIFQTVKTRLKNIYDIDHIQNGISEEDIIREYSKEYNIKEDDFKTIILPRLREIRRHDGEVKEFESYVHGRIRTVWQYLGY